MALPRQVQKQLKDGEELEKALQAQSDQETKVAETTEATEVKEPKAKKAKDEKVEPDTETKETAETELNAAPVEVKPADTSPTDVEDEFKQKYNTLRGKYDAEVPRLHSQV